MQAWEAIQKTLDYMEEHYEEELTIEHFSSIAHLSKFYYQRLFYRLTGYTAVSYTHLDVYKRQVSATQRQSSVY